MSAEDRRGTILTAAAHAFGERGYNATTIAAIAAAAGVSKPMVYRHFESKKALYLFLLAKHREDLPTFFAGIELAPGGSAEAALRLILERWFGYVATHSHAWKMLFRDRTGDDEIQAFRADVSRRAREVIAGFIEALGGTVPPAQVAPTAELLTSGLAGLALWSIDHPDFDRSDLIAVAVRIAAPAFPPETPASRQ